jgi:hypothetical protein
MLGIQHGAEMLSMCRDQSNQAKFVAALKKNLRLPARFQRGHEAAASE